MAIRCINNMTPNQKSAILKKIGRPEGFSLPYHPKDIRPYLLTITNSLDRLNDADGFQLRQAIYSIYALDRDQKPYSENWVKENEDSYTLLKSLLQKNMIPQTCEKCEVSEDAMKFETRRICQDCINNMK